MLNKRAIICKLDNWHEKRVRNHANLVDELQLKIENLYIKNKQSAIYTIAKYRSDLEARKIRIVVFGICFFVVSLQSLVLFFYSLLQKVANSNIDIVATTLANVSLGFFLFSVVFYLVILHNYKNDKMIFEIKERRFNELCAEDA